MIWLIIVIPVVIVCGIAIYYEKKTGAVPPDTNKGNHNVESITSNSDKGNFDGL
jgi:hypothetical protein